jgi:hypothetical protein
MSAVDFPSLPFVLLIMFPSISRFSCLLFTIKGVGHHSVCSVWM